MIKKNALIAYGSTIFLTIILSLVIGNFYNLNWHIPILYSGDAPWTLMTFKSLINNSWMPFTNPHSPLLAAPSTLTLGDFPAVENLFFIIIKILDIFFNDYVVTYNAYIFLTFILTSTAFVYAAKKIDISYPVGIVCGILFSFLPFHFIRIQHIFLDSYFLIPLAIVVIMMLWDEKPLIINKKNRWFAVITTILMGSSGIYYSFFYAFFAVIAGISNSLYRKSKKHLISSGIIIAITIATLLINMLPSFIYSWQNGANTDLIQRHPIEAEFYALKLTKMVLPVEGHRLSFLGDYAKEYYSYINPIIEGSNEYIGIIALIGLIFLFSRLILIKRETNIYNGLAALAISGFMLGTVGGFGSLFALIISPNIRSYNRVSILIAAIALITIALLLENARKKLGKNLWHALLAAVLVIGLFDQTSPALQFNQPEQATVISDRDFVKTIENTVPKDSNIFQLPFAAFPESPPVEKMRDYSHFKGYLNSDTLKWSYGAVKGRPEAKWYEQTSKLPATEMIAVLKKSGFTGIYVDRLGYPDQAAKISTELTEVTKKKPFASRDKRLLFFPL